jgi:hypothetical protein
VGAPDQGRYPALDVNDRGCPGKPDHLSFPSKGSAQALLLCGAAVVSISSWMEMSAVERVIAYRNGPPLRIPTDGHGACGTGGTTRTATAPGDRADHQG